VITIELRQRVTAADKADNPYVELPFVVPAGIRRIELSYSYEGQDEGAAEIDLGLIDPRGTAFPDFVGFRGWSGTFRTSAFVSERSATPGFVPGPILPGSWRVLLGLYRLPETPVEVRADVRLLDSAGEGPHPWPEPPSAPAGRGPGWFRGELHSHSHHSDAPGSLDDLIARARERKLDFLAVTEHNTVSHLPYLAACPSDLLLLPGVEITTYDGHMNAWGVSHPLDFRCTDTSRMAALIKRAHELGWVCSASHPIAPGMDWKYGYDLPLDCLEVWHGPSRSFNVLTMQAWDELLEAGRRVVAVGGGDHHEGKEDSIANPVVWIRANELDSASILDSLRKGHVVLTAPDVPRIELEVEHEGSIFGPGDEAPAAPVRVRIRPERAQGLRVRLVTALGEAELSEAGELDLAEHRYVRAELRYEDSDDPFPVAALTNPVWASPVRRETIVQMGDASSDTAGGG
jgi:PHP domain